MNNATQAVQRACAICQRVNELSQPTPHGRIIRSQRPDLQSPNKHPFQNASRSAYTQLRRRIGGAFRAARPLMTSPHRWAVAWLGTSVSETLRPRCESSTLARCAPPFRFVPCCGLFCHSPRCRFLSRFPSCRAPSFRPPPIISVPHSVQHRPPPPVVPPPALHFPHLFLSSLALSLVIESTNSPSLSRSTVTHLPRPKRTAQIRTHPFAPRVPDILRITPPTPPRYAFPSSSLRRAHVPGPWSSQRPTSKHSNHP